MEIRHVVAVRGDSRTAFDMFATACRAAFRSTTDIYHIYGPIGRVCLVYRATRGSLSLSCEESHLVPVRVGKAQSSAAAKLFAAHYTTTLVVIFVRTELRCSASIQTSRRTD
jgi:hypothetical protein